MKTGTADRRGNFPLKPREIAALRGNRPTSHPLEALCGREDRCPARCFVLMKHQALDVDSFDDVVLDGKRIGARITHITRKTRIDVVEQHDSQAHAVRHVTGARRHHAYAAIPIAVAHLSASSGRPRRDKVASTD